MTWFIFPLLFGRGAKRILFSPEILQDPNPSVQAYLIHPKNKSWELSVSNHFCAVWTENTLYPAYSSASFAVIKLLQIFTATLVVNSWHLQYSKYFPYNILLSLQPTCKVGKHYYANIVVGVGGLRLRGQLAWKQLFSLWQRQDLNQGLAISQRGEPS